VDEKNDYIILRCQRGPVDRNPENFCEFFSSFRIGEVETISTNRWVAEPTIWF